MMRWIAIERSGFKNGNTTFRIAHPWRFLKHAERLERLREKRGWSMQPVDARQHGTRDPAQAFPLKASAADHDIARRDARRTERGCAAWMGWATALYLLRVVPSPL